MFSEAPRSSIYAVVIFIEDRVEKLVETDCGPDRALNMAAAYNNICREVGRWAAAVPYPLATEIFTASAQRKVLRSEEAANGAKVIDVAPARVLPTSKQSKKRAGRVRDRKLAAAKGGA